VGLSHLPRNSKIFSSADLAIGVDVLSECIKDVDENDLNYHALLPSEVGFATAISAHNCAFRLSGVTSMEHMPTIFAQGRASLSASVSASVFVLSGFISFAFFCLFSLFSVSTAIPYIPLTGAFIFLQVILPLIAIPMAMSDSDQHCMQEVPPKNDASVSFGKKENKVFFGSVMLKSIIPAVFSQLIYLIAFGEFMIAYDNGILQMNCPSQQAYQPGQWTKVIRCSSLSGYSGSARDMASVLSLAELTLCTILASTSFLYRVLSMREEPPWHRNHLWFVSVFLGLLVLTVYLLMSLDDGAFSHLPWYFFFLAFFIMPIFCVTSDEFLKRPERRVMDRAEKLRRLQFETRLGMWSPK
jgi:magnesium-transporting ATPase (P-type)